MKRRYLYSISNDNRWKTYISLKKNGYIPLGKKFIIHDNYFIRAIAD